MEVELTPFVGRPFNNDEVDEVVTEIKDSPGVVLGGNAHNPDASDTAYLLFFNVAPGDVTLGDTEPVYSVSVPPATSVAFVPPRPVRCATAISVAAATSRLGNTAPSSALSVWVSYF